MIICSLSRRFSFSKVQGFWDILLSETSCPDDYLDYSAKKRDAIIFQLLYSYGLKPIEVLKLSILDFNFYESEKDDSFGSIFISNGDKRLIYPIFSEATLEIKKYLDIYNLYHKTPTNIFFKTATGKELTIPYLKSRLNHYNSRLSSSFMIGSLYSFRQYYIADLLRIKGISQSFINNQIGNNLLSNQVYFHLQPNKNGMEYFNEF